jgi:anti-sigma-K factor RskA
MHPEQTDETTDLLVAYALGALEPEAMEQISRLLAERPELRTTLAELTATAGLLPYGLPESAPPPELRQRVLDHAVGRAARSVAPAPVAEVGRRLRGWLYGLGGLAAVALAALAFALVQLGGARTDLVQAQQQLVQAQQQLVAAQEQIAAVSSGQADLAQALVNAERVGRLAGPGGLATVLQTSSGEALVAAQLPPLASGQVYQLWIIAGDAAPQSGGVFTVDSSGFGVIALDPGAVVSGYTLAVTAEPAPGSPGPTTEILVVGQLA